jgi:hypothetical protein
MAVLVVGSSVVAVFTALLVALSRSWRHHGLA